MSDDIKPTDAETRAIISVTFNAAKKEANVIYYAALDKLDLAAELICASAYSVTLDCIKAARETAYKKARAEFTEALDDNGRRKMNARKAAQ